MLMAVVPTALKAQSTLWELNDVSVLFALPKETDSKNFLLTTQSKGKLGPLFPQKHADAIKDLIISYDRPEPDNVYLSLRAVGMRIDPCFKFTTSSYEKCSPQLRLVWQPTKGLNTKNVHTFDAAVHTFYALTDTEFNLLSDKLMKLKMKNQGLTPSITTRGLALGVHPAYRNPERRHSFNEEIKNIILAHAGEKNLVRFTFMQVLTKNLWWSFGGQDRKKDGTWISMAIPRLTPNDIKHDFFNDDPNDPLGMRGTIMPNVSVQTDDLSQLIQGYGVHNNQEGLALMKTGFRSINRIENPKIHSPATLDCVHCHITEATKLWAQKEKNELFKKSQTNESRFVQAFHGRHNLSNSSQITVHNKSLRAFGYFEAMPSVNQRAINESAHVADEMNSKNKK